MLIDSSLTADDPPGSQPKFFSKEWFFGIGGALLIWKYSARDFAVYNVSSVITLAQVTFLTSMWSTVKTYISNTGVLDTLQTATGAMWGSVKIVAMGAVELFSDFLLN